MENNRIPVFAAREEDEQLARELAARLGSRLILQEEDIAGLPPNTSPASAPYLNPAAAAQAPPMNHLLVIISYLLLKRHRIIPTFAAFVNSMITPVGRRAPTSPNRR